jgi:hypothetical protein
MQGAHRVFFSFHSLTATPSLCIACRCVALALALIASPLPFCIAPCHVSPSPCHLCHVALLCHLSSCIDTSPSPLPCHLRCAALSHCHVVSPLITHCHVVLPLVMHRPIATHRPRPRCAQAARLLTGFGSAAEMEGCEWVGWKCRCRQ